MKKTTKILAVILCVLFAFAIFASCNSDDGKADTTTNNNAGNNENANVNDDVEKTTENNLLYDNIPELDFEGYEFRVLFGTYGDRSGVHFYPESEEGEVLSDAFYKRNKKIEERFNVAIKATTMDGGGPRELSKNVNAGDDAYDLYMMVDREAQTAATSGQLYPLGNVEYIDLSQPYWLRDVNNIMTVGGKLPWAFSEEMLSVFENTTVIFYNKKQAAALQFEDLYGLVKNGEWTIDKLFELAKAGIKNVSGESSYTTNDYWGIVTGYDTFATCFWIGAGITTVSKSNDDIPYFSLPGNEKFLTLGQKIFDYRDIAGMYMEVYTTKLLPNTGMDAKLDFFRSGQVLFSTGTIQEIVSLRDMPDDFGVLPCPKYDAQQSRYYSRIEGGRPFVIPQTNQRTDVTGAIMEAMACETRNTVYPAYYEFALKNKFSRDPETCEMLDLVRETLVYDLGDTIYMEHIRNPLTQNIFNGKENTLTSWIEKNEIKINGTIRKMADKIIDAD